MNLAKIIYSHKYHIVFWDLGGQSKIRSMWEKYYLEADCIIYVVDSVDQSRLEETKSAFVANVLSDKTLENTPIILLCNKQDMQVFPFASNECVFVHSLIIYD